MQLKVTGYAVAERIATITLQRPARLNAWTGRMQHEYLHCLAAANADAQVGAIVLTGAGRGFCAGGDSTALAGHADRGSYDAGTPEAMPRAGYGVDASFDAPFACHFGLDKPLVAAINGAVAGVGLALACFADLRFAAAGAKFTTAHGKLNLPAEYGLSWLLPRIVGLGRGLELLLSSRVFLADEALAMGLVHRVLEPAELMPAVYAYTRELIATVSPNALRQTRWQVYRDLHRSVADAVRDSERLLETMVTEADYREGVRAFVDKRRPRFGQPPGAG